MSGGSTDACPGGEIRPGEVKIHNVQGDKKMLYPPLPYSIFLLEEPNGTSSYINYPSKCPFKLFHTLVPEAALK